jgi:alpha/beta superfamily hydrolase
MGVRQEKPVLFSGPAGLLEGRMAGASQHSGGALIMLHPHPLFGGNMQNNVIDAVILAAGRCGLATLRFNFRGVGESQGRFDDGNGEQDDVAAAISFMARESGTRHLILAGYSFGASVAVSYCHGADHGVKHLYLIAPPPDLLGEGLSLEIPETRKIILGENDTLASPREVYAVLSEEARKSLVEVIPQTDHFFSGKAAVLIRVFEDLFSHHV